MRVLLLPSPDTTSFNIIIRCLSIALEAMAAGHEAAIAAPAALVDRFSKMGVATFDYPVPTYIENATAEIEPIQKWGDYAELIGLVEEGFVRSSLQAEAEAIERFEPDIIYSDINLTAPISARIFNRPLASLCNLAWTPPHLGDADFSEDQAQIALLNRLLRGHGLAPVRDTTDLIYTRSDLKLVPSCPEFESFPDTINNIEYIGYLYSEALEQGELEVEMPGDMVNLLVYMGIGDITLDMMQEVLPGAFDSSRYNVVVVVGDFYSQVPPATSNVTYVRFVPLQKALARSDLAIFHGGSGLVMTCLLYGVPGLMFPCGVYEREFHAQTMAKVGAGVVMSKQHMFNVRELQAQVERVLSGEYAARAADFGHYLRSLGGPGRAVQLLEQLARTGVVRSAALEDQPARSS